MELSIRSFRPENFEREVIAEKKPVLVLCMPRDIEFAGQLELLEEVARQQGEGFKIGFLEEEFIDTFKKIYDVLGTPTFLIFVEGKEKRRLLGLADHETITDFILND